MKKILLCAFTLFLCFCFIACDKDDEDNDINELAEIKSSAVLELENFFTSLNESEYINSDWIIIQNKIFDAKISIQEAINKNEVDNIVNDTKILISDIAKIDLLADAKKAAKSIISALPDTDFFEENYSEDDWNEIKKVISNALINIDNSISDEEIENVISYTRQVIATYMTLDQRLQIIKDEVIAQLNEEFEKYSKDDYSADDYNTINNLYQSAQISILLGNNENDVRKAFCDVIERMAAIQKLLFITYENIENSLWLYSSALEMREDLLADFNTAKRESMSNSAVVENYKNDFTFETFPLGSFDINDMVIYFYYSEINNEKMSEKWDFLFKFLMENTPSETNKKALKLMFSYNSAEELIESSSYSANITPYAISYDFSAFLIAGIYRKGNGTFETADYSKDEELQKVFDYLSAETSYVQGTVYEIPSPARKYQDFLGWYDNPDFYGEPITVVKDITSSITLYAKWTELTTDDELEIYKDAKIKELEEYLSTSKNKNEYNSNVWSEIEATLEEGITNIHSQDNSNDVDNAFNNAKNSLDNIKPTIYTVTYNLNGGHWLYSNKEELVKGFLTDFSKMTKTTVTVNNFFAQSFGNANLFFTEYVQWTWLLEYLETIQPTLRGKMIIDSSGMALVRINIQGYLSNGICQNDTGAYVSCDYSSFTNDLGFVEYLKDTEFKYVDEYTLLVPIKNGYKFIGWYDNPEFAGEAIDKVNANITLYAKFEEFTDTDILLAAIDSAKAEFYSYIEENKDLTKFNDDDLELFNNKVNDLVTTIENAKTLESVSMLLEEAKIQVAEFEYSIYQVEFVLNGGHWYFANKEEMVNAFMEDIHKYFPNATKENIYANTYSNDGKINTFFKESKQWQWLLTYLATTCDPSKADKFKIDASLNLPEVRIELEGFLNDKKAENGVYASSDYSGEDDNYAFTKYYQDSILEFVNSPSDIPSIYKNGYIFVGWYTNSEFTGDIITAVTNEAKLYAKWEISE